MINHRQLYFALQVLSTFGSNLIPSFNKYSFESSLASKLDDIVDNDAEILNVNDDIFDYFDIAPEDVMSYAINVQEKTSFNLRINGSVGISLFREQLKDQIGSNFLYTNGLDWVKVIDNYSQYLEAYNATRYSVGLNVILPSGDGYYGHIEYTNHYTKVTKIPNGNDGYITENIDEMSGGSLTFAGSVISEFGNHPDKSQRSFKQNLWNSHLNESYTAEDEENNVSFTIKIASDKKRFIEGVKICLGLNSFKTGEGSTKRYDYFNRMVIDEGTLVLPAEVANPSSATSSSPNQSVVISSTFRSVITGRELLTFQSVMDLMI